MTRTAKGGFTLVETLIALLLVSAIAYPSCLWFYRSRVHRVAWEKFHATQIIEERLGWIILVRDAHSPLGSNPSEKKYQIEIATKNQGDAVQFQGTARDKKGKTLVVMEAILFDRDVQ